MASNHVLDALGHAASGSAGTAVSTAALYPLDLVTTRLKAQRSSTNDDGGKTGTTYNGLADGLREIFRNEGGIRALYRGLGTDVAKSAVDSFLFFGFYNYLQRKHAGRFQQGGSAGAGRGRSKALQELAVGALAGACTRALTTPIANVVARKQTSSADCHKTLGVMLREIYVESGFLGLWSGYSATIFLTMNPSITFFVDRRLAKRILPALKDEDVPVAYIAFLLAAFSKATATAITYPFQAAKTRLQVAKTPGRNASSNEKSLGSQMPPTTTIAWFARLLNATIFGVIFRIVKEEGVRALYNGVRGELLKSFFSHGLTMFAKGILHRLIVRLWFLHGAKFSKRLMTREGKVK